MIDVNVAYLAVFNFLEETWQVNKEVYDDDLPILLGNMQLAGDGKPCDPAEEQNWKEATLGKTELTPEEVYDTMIRFLEIYVKIGESDTRDISILIIYLKENCDYSGIETE